MAENFWALNVTTIVGWVILLGGLVVFIVRLESKTRENCDDIEDLKEATKDGHALTNRVTTLETKISLFWGLMEKQAATILHHPITPDRDKLIDGYLEGELSSEELQEFVHLLDSIVKDNNQSSGERMAAAFLLASIYNKHGFPHDVFC
jgi:hypothetical protein